ncbi:hypothetical protein PLESTB_000547500 [Pleodorina starrii]|uniref:Uncharacterized protein n=1 Tax=Pleodorina starrii TaxID=330485 RepID=A0A9W6F144_9CHLO|nr:hypothetical protein PLESTM_000272500 [Pleodorina starrii]GLC51781.1 hypothetical protein PLESTB_000547500 [Pleodorina starrii]GLC69493.1 hypothetical protein PLESTF_000837900 [Pleodorina starrii]
MSALSKRLLYGWTELHVAADAGDLAKVRQIVQKNPTDLDRVTKDGRTALQLAAANGFEAVVGELLDRQAKTTKQDESGRTALHLAAAGGRTRCVAALLGPRNRDSAAEKSRLLGLRDREGRDALMSAVVEGRGEVMEELLRAGADAQLCVDSSQCGPVIVAVRCGHLHLLPALVRACGGPDVQRDPATGGTALHAAASRGDLPMLDCLLAVGASTTTRDNTGRTASDAALAAGQHTAFRALREGPAAARGAGGGGAAAAAAAAAAPHDHNLLQPSPKSAAAQGDGGSATPWGELPWPAQRSSASRLEIPTEAPQPVYYPTPPSGAGVYF